MPPAVNLAVSRNRQPKSISVVVPCYNEEAVLPELFRRLHGILGTTKIPYEIVLVDDGSTDGTWALLRALQLSDRQVKIIRLARNSGQQLALTCGLDSAEGEVIAVMDADLQDPPELLHEMIDAWSRGYDVVYGQRASRRSDPLLKRLFAHMFYRVFARLSGFEIPLDTGDFRLMDRRVVDAVCSMRERHRFTRGIVAWVGFSQTAVRYERPPRFAGVTKYPFRKQFRLAFDAIASFSSLPLRAGIYLGGSLLVLAVLLLGYWFFRASPDSARHASLISGLVLALGGLQLCVLGIIGEYIGRIFEQSQGRPLYLVAERVGDPLSMERAAMRVVHGDFDRTP